MLTVLVGSAETRHTHKCQHRHRSDGQLLHDEKRKEGVDEDRQAEAEQTSASDMDGDSRQEPAKCSQPIQLHQGKTERERERKIGREKNCKTERERKKNREREKL